VNRIDPDAVYPRDEAHRYRLYGRDGDALTVLACAPDPEGVGAAIAQLHADQREHGGTLGDLGQIGILDAVEREWIVNPFPRVRSTA
jgi:hypothetical protein